MIIIGFVIDGTVGDIVILYDVAFNAAVKLIWIDDDVIVPAVIVFTEPISVPCIGAGAGTYIGAGAGALIGARWNSH